MQKFEAGKIYKVNGNGYIHVNKRTDHFIVFSGDYTGRKRIDAQSNLLNMGEYILIEHPKDKAIKLFCFASNITRNAEK